jgi:hypothetical protein
MDRVSIVLAFTHCGIALFYLAAGFFFWLDWEDSNMMPALSAIGIGLASITVACGLYRRWKRVVIVSTLLAILLVLYHSLWLTMLAVPFILFGDFSLIVIAGLVVLASLGIEILTLKRAV